jgi:hypothetical protein
MKAKTLSSAKSSFYGTKFLKKIFGRAISFVVLYDDHYSFRLNINPIFGKLLADLRISFMLDSGESK